MHGFVAGTNCCALKPQILPLPPVLPVERIIASPCQCALRPQITLDRFQYFVLDQMVNNSDS